MSTNNNILCGDLWTQVLARLPVKTLLRLRSVCKTWCTIIEDPYFMSIHLKQYHNNNNGSSSHYDKTQLLCHHIERDGNLFIRSTIWVRNWNTLTKTSKLVESSDKAYSLVGNTCFGLILMLCYYPRRELRLWNPSLRKSIVLPSSPFITSTTLHVVHTLGFSNSTRCFKVAAFQVDMSWENRHKILSVAVYTVGADDDNNNNKVWRIITPDNSLIDAPYLEGLVFFQGASHWTVCDETISSDASTHLVSFDFDSEKFSLVELPDAREQEGAVKIVFLLGEALAFMSVTEMTRRVWVANKDDSGLVSWSLWFSGGSSEPHMSIISDQRRLNSNIYYFDDGGTTFTFGNSSYDIGTTKMTKLLKLSSDDTLNLHFYFETLALCKEGQAFP
ncbi:putative F-box protein At4g38870 [Silene latifolia]|uniref:putative F-box protein At4g38870 n=1 Tax=Silene latifolia TaxID=37657 RepID=UPI003D77C8A3